MAAYKEHISVSGFLGAVYGLVATFAFGFSPVQGALAGCLAWFAGMLPDLDSQSGKPIREVFSLLAALAPRVMMQWLYHWAGSAEGAMLLAVLLYVVIRYGGAFVLSKLAVHRGMFHSVPALLIDPVDLLILEKTVVRIGVGVAYQQNAKPVVIDGGIDRLAEVLGKSLVRIVVAGDFVDRFSYFFASGRRDEEPA